ncbi:15697_t:CDS:10 [Cetraspora pellucida]|uniref:15697_t:CDS:1 n=1 Tax=Cetraspora pellucida TaxID=1433469 RepID=A0ACA9KJ65_9GLOM|nr:15697_t:CDS:10 [Cetraspora pellucida]
MYNRNQPTYSNRYQPQQHTVSPPPLQHPIPTHPPIQMRDPPTSSPSPPTHLQATQHLQPTQQQQLHNANIWYINDTTTQMGMEFGRTALSAGTEYIDRYVDIPALKYYFKVNNSYVANKIQLLLFPWRHKRWTRIVLRSEQDGQLEGFKPPRDDINSPDLYIPAMALVTYVLLTGIVSGTQGNKFHPEILGVNATSAFFLVLLELIFIKIGCYLLNITDANILNLLAYSGYKFVGVIVTLAVSLIAPFWIVASTFIYTAFASGFFLLRSLRQVVFPDASSTVNIQHRQKRKRIHFLFLVAALQRIDFIKHILIIMNSESTTPSQSPKKISTLLTNISLSNNNNDNSTWNKNIINDIFFSFTKVDYDQENLKKKSKSFEENLNGYIVNVKKNMESRRHLWQNTITSNKGEITKLQEEIKLFEKMRKEFIKSLENEKKELSKIQMEITNLKLEECSRNEGIIVLKKRIERAEEDIKQQREAIEVKRALLETQLSKNSPELNIFTDKLALTMERVRVIECDPILEELDELVSQLNTSRDFFSFLKKMRHGFRKHAKADT